LIVYSGSALSLMKRTLSGFKWSYLSALLQAILELAVIVVLARLLSPRDFGLLGIALIFTGLAELVSELGIGLAIIQRKELTDSGSASREVYCARMGPCVARRSTGNTGIPLQDRRGKELHRRKKGRVYYI